MDKERLVRILQLLGRVEERPPRVLRQVLTFIHEFSRDVSALHNHVEFLCDSKDVTAQRDFAVRLWKIIQVLFRTMVFNLDQTVGGIPMKRESAWTPLMCLFKNIAVLVVLWNALCTSSMTKLPLAWDLDHAASDDVYLLDNGVVICEKKMKDYSVCDMVDALRLLNDNWHRLIPNPSVMTHLTRLFHRACFLVSCPGDQIIYDDDEYSVEIRHQTSNDDNGNDGGDSSIVSMKSCNSRLLRLLSGQISRMMSIIMFARECDSLWGHHFIESQEKANPSNFDFDGCAKRLRSVICNKAAFVAKFAEGRTFVSRCFYRLIVTFGDLEEFMDKQDMERPDPQAVMMTTKTPEAQQAWATLNQAMHLENVPVLMREEEPGYFDEFTYPMHIYNVVLKTYIIDLLLKETRFSIRDAHIIWQTDLPVTIPSLMGKKGPFFIHYMGAFDVFFNGALYRCKSVEEAIIIWMFIVLRAFDGIIDGCDLTKVLKKILFDEIYDQRQSGHVVEKNHIIGKLHSIG